MNNKNTFLLPALLMALVCAFALYFELRPHQPKAVIITSFKPITNYAFSGTENLFNVNLSTAIDSGIIAPVKGQTPGGYFVFTSKITVAAPGTYHYKIYYQNDSYKMPLVNADGVYDTLAAENFYGSWEDNTITFKELKADKAGTYSITDSFRILGNPRNEAKYFGKDMRITEDTIAKMIAHIFEEPKWLEWIDVQVKEKKITRDEALRNDAIWAVKEMRHKEGKLNHRWKRNPRMGTYSAMLVVATDSAYKTIPDYIGNIGKTGPKGYFVNPFYYFKYEAKNMVGLAVTSVPKFIKLKARLTPNEGVYVENYDYSGGKPDTAYYSNTCGCRSNLYHTANFEQFFHGINKDFTLNTIPVSADVEHDEYSRDDYYAAEKKYKPEAYVKNYIRITDSPCKTVQAKGNYIEIHNPGNANPQQARKENVGIKTRHGFSYGKVTAKIKFPALINKTNVWTGITQAVWLLFQDKEQWNFRRNAIKGYTPKGSHTADAPRIPSTYYTEIDFEILKTSQYWPQNMYPKALQPQRVENAQETDDIVVTTTNWDLANPDPSKYGAGIMRIPYKGQTFEAARWDAYYQALTIRKAVKQSKILNHDYYYYQIEWKPKEIIWRIGPSKDKLFVVGYMNDEYTSIPNNQMVLVITQEYHLSDWWPPIPFKQELIPFPKNDLVGKVYEVEVE